MKANELRIGNLVYDTRGYVNIVTIDALRYMDTYSGAICQAKPIPLTAKWLEKLGFEKYNDRWWKNDTLYRNCFDIIDSFDAFCFKTCMWTSNKIKYVHQLQNLFFALTGEELTIKEAAK